MGILSTIATAWLPCLGLMAAQRAVALPASSSSPSPSPSPLSNASLLTVINPTVLNPTVPKEPAMDVDFPEPRIVQDRGGTWYAFATNRGGRTFQAVRAISPAGPWYHLDTDAMSDPGPWTTGWNAWAPDVRPLAGGSYALYYSGEQADDPLLYCIGIATSRTGILGPYEARDEPLRCHLDWGGAIDASGFYDPATGRYVVYKIDGNSIGRGGDCNNGVKRLVPTPLMLQELEADGVTAKGDPVEILDGGARDGPLVEAPDIVRASDGSYVHLFSSYCWPSPGYDINYAVADRVEGPYVRSGRPLVRTGDFNLTSPGGATAAARGGYLALHANCPQGRCMFMARFGVLGRDVIVT